MDVKYIRMRFGLVLNILIPSYACLNSIARKLPEIPDVSRNVSPVGLLEAATSPC